MVWFTFNFLLGIPINNKEKNFDKFQENDEKLENGKNYIERDVSKPNFSCHIEYILLPNQPSKFIDVVCWDQAAKIYFENSTSAIIPLIIGELGWIYFRVNHKIKLATEDIPNFHKHTVKFSVKLGTKKLGEDAKSDKPKKFYSPKFPTNNQDYFIRKQLFQPLSETLEDLPSLSFFKEHLTSHQQLHISLDCTMEISEYFKKLYKVLTDLSNEYNDANFIKVPTPSYEELPPLINVLRSELNVVTLDIKKEKEKKQDLKKKEDVNEQIEFFITGEDFLSGKNIFENCLKYKSEELPFIFCLSTVKNLLDKIQIQNFNPLSITLSHINYLPVEELQKCGVTKIKFQYLIFNEFLTESNLFPISSNMKLNYVRTILTNSIDRNQLIHFIQTGGLKVHLMGKKKEVHINGKKTYSQELINNRLNILRKSENSYHRENNELVLLGTAFIDISKILFQPHRILFKSNFKLPSPDVLGKSPISTCLTTLNEFNSCSMKIKKLNHGQNINLTTPILTVFASISYPIAIIYQKVLMDPKLFNRLFVVLYDTNLAVQIIQIIQEDFELALQPKDYNKNGINIKRPLSKRNLNKKYSSTYFNKYQITGFLIDCIDKILIYIESSVFGNIQKIWTLASSISPSKGRVLYDSSLVFLDRLYENFLKIGGVFTIILKELMEVILSRPKAYGSGNIPVPALNALTRLHLLSGCKSIQVAVQNNLFPDPDSLFSLAIEFGTSAEIYK